MKKAVITGDIIQSGKLKPEEKEWLIKNIKSALKIWNKDFQMKSEMYRGDSFQCLLQEPVQSMRVALIIKTFIKSLNPSEIFDMYNRKNLNIKTAKIISLNMVDTRISIGIGSVELEMKSIATSDGVAFNISGANLDKIKSTRQSIIIGTDDDHNAELETEIILLDNIISTATAMQCEVIYLKLLGYTEIKIANILKIKQSAVNQRSIAAGWNAIETLIKRFETIYG
ncbi:MAG TPA: hypothetical protein PKN48_15365 [Bacteroidales bacterium]|nr:hypothetical protein [Bacteroidales bacterium]